MAAAAAAASCVSIDGLCLLGQDSSVFQWPLGDGAGTIIRLIIVVIMRPSKVQSRRMAAIFFSSPLFPAKKSLAKERDPREEEEGRDG